MVALLYFINFKNCIVRAMYTTLYHFMILLSLWCKSSLQTQTHSIIRSVSISTRFIITVGVLVSNHTSALLIMRQNENDKSAPLYICTEPFRMHWLTILSIKHYSLLVYYSFYIYNTYKVSLYNHYVAFLGIVLSTMYSLGVLFTLLSSVITSSLIPRSWTIVSARTLSLYRLINCIVLLCSDSV